MKQEGRDSGSVEKGIDLRAVFDIQLTGLVMHFLPPSHTHYLPGGGLPGWAGSLGD